MKQKELLIALMVSGVACSSPIESSLAPADSVYTNARIYTVDNSNPWAHFIAVTDGKIVAVGSESESANFIGTETVVHDLNGRMLMPGIHDTHMHPTDAGIGKTLECSFLTNLLSEALEVLKTCLAGLQEGEWLRGGQWNESLFVGVDKSPKEILDEIAPNRPVFLMDWSVHNAWVNSKALTLFEIDQNTPDPNGGIIVRDSSTGAATGILLDNAAYDYRRELPEYNLQQLTSALAWSLDLVAKQGITTFKEAIVTTTSMRAYDELERQGKLFLNANTNLTWKSSWANSHAEEVQLIEVRDQHATDNIKTDFVKIMLDGIPPTYTAALLEPYEPNAAFGNQWRGKLMHTPEALAADVTQLDAQGLSVMMHATGDRSLRVALDAVAAARQKNGDSGILHIVSHAEMIHPDDIPRFVELNVAAEMCPILWYPIPGLDWKSWVGEERAKIWPVKALLEAGALVVYGSDWPVVATVSPWPGIESMVTRSDPAGASDTQDWPEQAIDLASVVRIFTLNGAKVNKVGDTSGSLEPGKDADFIVLDRNIFEVPISEVGETEVLLTVVGGEVLVNKL